MASPNEGSTRLPSDDGTAGGPGARFFWGLWDAIGGKFWAWRGTTQGNAIVQIEKGTSVNTQVNATGTSGLLLAANAIRKKATFYNNGTQSVYISKNSPALTSDYVIPAGAEYADDTGTGAWYVLASSGTQDIRVQEFS